ncbi:hypothetical protein ADL27_28030 [Streptomyces sp. NRRL F-6602]|nr:hypothetical protein ADL27_28030 [Streptomyces sp. NRRL F-6602]
MSEEEQRAAGHAGAAGEGTGQGAGPAADGSGGTGGKPGAPGTSGVSGASGASGAREGAGQGSAQGAEPSWGAHNPPPGAAKGQPLRRSRTHKIAGGVCGGMGRYFDLDPVIFRVPLVVLSVVGGLGLVSYGFAWLLIPAEGESQNEGRRLLSGRVEGSSLSAVLFALVGCGLFLASLGNRSVPYSLLLIGAVAGAAYWSQHRRQAEAAGAEGAQVDPATAHAVADAPPETQAPPVPVPASWWREPLTKDGGGHRPLGPWSQAGAATGYLWGPQDASPRTAPSDTPQGPGGTAPGARPGGGAPGGPPVRPGQGGFSLGGLTFLGAVLAGGAATAAFWSTHPLATTLTVGLSCALAVLGLGLAVSAFVGRTGPGTILCLVLTAVLLAGAAALPKDISTNVRDTRWVPTGVQEVEQRYALGTGRGELDLRETGLKAGRTLRTSARVGAGELTVVVPDDAAVKVTADVGMGETRFPRGLDGDGNTVFDSSGGIGETRSLTLRPFDGADAKGTVELRLSVGVGRVEIVRRLPSGERSDRPEPPDAPAPAAPTGAPGAGESRDSDTEQGAQR